MSLTIRTTGLENYSASGTGRVKVLVIGGPGVGKTRWSSYFPKPIYLDCEGGLASVADRNVPYATIKNSNDMLEALTYLRQESTRPEQDRQYRTVVVDTLDAFQRKVKDEWLIAHPNEQSFRGFEAWGYLDTKMQMLLTRLLNLDMNVVVAVHYTDKTITEGTGNDQVQRQEIQLQLSGAIKDQVFNDFDLVGWMGTYYEAVNGQRVERRGLTFKSTFEKPFLKDRLHVTPDWMQVKFSDEDYATLFAAVISRMDDLAPSMEVGEIPSLAGQQGQPPAGVVGPLPGGALPPMDPKEIPLANRDKPSLQILAKELGVDFKSNDVKAELVAKIEAKQAELAAAPAEVAPAEVAPTAESTPDSPAVTEAEGEPKLTEEQRREAAFARLAAQNAPPATSTPVEATPTPPAAETVLTEDPKFVVDQGRTINTETGEIMEATPEEATATVEQTLGGEVVSITQDAEAAPMAQSEAAAPAPVAAAPAAPAPAVPGQRVRAEHCEEPGCEKPIGPNPDYVKLSYIKFRKDYCDDHYLAHKRAS